MNFRKILDFLCKISVKRWFPFDVNCSTLKQFRHIYSSKRLKSLNHLYMFEINLWKCMWNTYEHSLNQCPCNLTSRLANFSATKSHYIWTVPNNANGQIHTFRIHKIMQNVLFIGSGMPIVKMKPRTDHLYSTNKGMWVLSRYFTFVAKYFTWLQCVLSNADTS